MGMLQRSRIGPGTCAISKGFVATLLLFLCLASTMGTVSAEGAGPQALSIRSENDSFGNTDENYTNGISLALTTPGDGPVSWVWGLLGNPAGQRFATYELTQLQFTPSDLGRSDPDPSDRPYAGVLYLGFATHVQREESLQSLKLLAGVVGAIQQPWSGPRLSAPRISSSAFASRCRSTARARSRGDGPGGRRRAGSCRRRRARKREGPSAESCP